MFLLQVTCILACLAWFVPRGKLYHYHLLCFQGGTYSLDMDESQLLLEFAERKSAVSNISKDIKVCIKIKECASAHHL
jgi:hypothetical protein